MLKKIIFLTLITSISLAASAESIQITIKGIRSFNGVVRIGVYKNNQSFQDDTPFKKITIKKNSLKNGVIKHIVNLPKGTYGFALLDDENNNGKMEESFFGIPEEGYGFSNYVHSGVFRPSFKDFSFTVSPGKDMSVTIQADYF